MNSDSKTPIFLRPLVAGESLTPSTPGLLVLASSDVQLNGRFCPLVETISVGRVLEGEVNFALNDGILSRRHFSISKDQAGLYWLSDPGSTNGTYLEGHRISRSQIELGAIVRAGETLFEFNEFPVPLPTAAAADDLLVWRSAAMAEVVAAVGRVSDTAYPVLIEGDTGSGKELIARRVHRLSGRHGAFVAVNCAAIPSELSEAFFFGHKKGAFTGATQDAPGQWTLANDGTLFLDEIGELSLPLQAKILRVLDSGEFTPLGGQVSMQSNARIVAATNVNLESAVASGKFRRDLYARLAVYLIHAPALRERRGDILLLFQHFLDQSAPGRRWSIDFAQHLLLHQWPMNVRELRALAQRLIVDSKGERLEEAHLPPALRTTPPLMETPDQAELERLLVHYRGNVAEVASFLNKDRKQIYRWIKRHGLVPEKYRQVP